MVDKPPRRWRRVLLLSSFVLVAIVSIITGALRASFPHFQAATPFVNDPGAIHRVPGAVHVHTERSHDSKLTIDEVVKAAQRVGLQFVVITDHDSPPKRGEEAFYAGNVLVIGAVEW